MSSTIKGIDKMLADKSLPIEHRKQVLQHLLGNESKECDKIIADLLETYGDKNIDAAEKEKLEELAAMIQSLKDGPGRLGTFLRTLEPSNGSAPRVEVLLSDGASVLSTISEPDRLGPLECGDTVRLDVQAKAVLARHAGRPIGGEARLVRRIDEQTVEVELDNQGKHVFWAAAELTRDLDAGTVLPGHDVIVCPQRRMAFRGVPLADGLAHYRFLDRAPVPDVKVERDIASPAAFIGQLSMHLDRELGGTTLARMYRLQRCRAVFLTGGTGTGKTLNIMGFIRRSYELMSERTGIPIDQLPPRVLRLRSSEILSKWYGEAERNIDAFFDELDALCAERVVDENGLERELPVLVIAEEVDGLTRERGSSRDSVDDRVQTTILQRLDTTARRLRDSLVIILCTSNVPSLLDPAFVRRAGGIIEQFGRLDRTVFEDIVTRKVRGVPFVAEAGEEGAAAVADLTAWLFSANADQGVVEVVYAGSTQGVKKYRRDFLTGALVERAVQQAADEACTAHEAGCNNPGLSTERLARAIDAQIGSIVEQLTEHNAHHHLDVPRGSRVASVRPIRTAEPIPVELLR